MTMSRIKRVKAGRINQRAWPAATARSGEMR
jgi:hypothetical protein